MSRNPWLTPKEAKASYEPHSIFILLNSRGLPGSYHWGLYIPTSPTQGHIWHADNSKDPKTWVLDSRVVEGLPASVPTFSDLIIAYRVAVTSDKDFDACSRVLSAVAVPAAGHDASLVSGETFTCRTWVKDAIGALATAKLITLRKSLEDIEMGAIVQAMRREEAIEKNHSGPVVIERTDSSTTA